MTSLSSVIVSYFVNSVWQVPLIAAAGWAMSRMLKKLGPQSEHVLWVSTLLLSILAPALPFFRRLLAVPHSVKEYLSITLVAAPPNNPNTASIINLPAVLTSSLLVLYIGSLLYFAARLGWSLYSTTKLLRGSDPSSLTPEQNEIWLRCKRAFSIGSARIINSQRISGPVAVGFRRSLLLIPIDFAEQCPSQDFLVALAHESAHIKRRDFLKNLFYEFASLIIAFHPVTWILKSHIAQTREMICDGMATERLINSQNYTQSLLRLATMIAMNPRVSTSNAIGIFDANILEKRIMMINRKKRHFSSALKYGLIIPSTLFLISVAIGGAAMAFAVQPQSPSHAADEAAPYGHVYKIGKDISAPILVESTDPVYPESARKTKDKFDGTCLIGLIVDASGVPQDVHIVRSLSPDFDANAISAVQQYRFTPAKRSGEPVAVALRIEVNFKKY